MYKTFLSWRYMRRRKTNIIGIVGIGVGVGALILILSIMSGFLEETKKTLRGGLSDLIIEPTQLPRQDGVVVPYSPEPVLEVVRADPRVKAACAQLGWFGIVAQGGRRAAVTGVRMSDVQSGSLAGVQLLGIDVQDEFQTTELRKALERESLVGADRVANLDRPFDPPPDWEPKGLPLASVVVGERLANDWRLSRGSEIEIVTTVPNLKSKELKPYNRSFVVAGTFRSGENEADAHCIYMDRRELADFLGPPRTFSQVLVKLKNYDRDARTMREELRIQLAKKGLIRTDDDYGEVRTWEEFKKTLLGAIENERVLMAIMLSLVVIVAAFTIFAILSMMVTEKRRDIGILTALGATPGGVTALFLLIGFWDTLVGASGGAVLGMWAAYKIDAIERWLSSTFHVQIFDRSVYLFDHIPAIVNPLWVAVIVLGAFVVALLFALVPAFKAGRLHPLDALRYE